MCFRRRCRNWAASGHFPLVVRGSYGTFVGLFEDLAGYWHGPSVLGGAAGTVFWRCLWQPNQPYDAHGVQPYATLVDSTVGGVLYGTGAGSRELPHHLRGLTFWNFEHRGRSSLLKARLLSLAAAQSFPGSQLEFPHYDFVRH